MYICFEGIDGCGKSTVSKAFSKRLKEAGYDVFETSEPNANTEFGRDIRKILGKNDGQLDVGTEALLFAASRREHLIQVVLPALSNHRVVVSDRCYLSSLIYQGYDCKAAKTIITAGLEYISPAVKPDIIFIIDADASICRDRNKGVDTKDLADLEIHSLRRQRYLSFAEHYPDKSAVCVINGNRTVEEIVEDVLEKVMQKINNYLREV